MGRLFGTDGVRGVANRELTPKLAFALGRAGAKVLGKGGKTPTFIIGKDTRISGYMLGDALSSGILSVGGHVLKAAVVPTPAVAYLVKHYQADAGIVISASHNPFEYNGIKFFNSEGFKLADEIEDEIEEVMRDEEENGPGEEITGSRLGRIKDISDEANDEYCKHLLSTIDIKLNGMKIVLDCANGASYISSPAVYRALGAEVITIGCEPNGLNINDHIGSTHPEKLQEKVLSENADLGLAFDGDADRLIAVDDKGRVVDGDKAICICAKMLKDKGSLKGDKVTATVMSNLGFHKYLKSIGASVDVTQVGDRYVLESMLKTGCVIGGEQSGHIIFLDYSTTGDGCLSSLQLMKAVKASGKKLSELSDGIKLYPQVLVNARVANENKDRFMEDPEVRSLIEKCEDDLADNGRVLIRASGTEPLVRVMLEGDDTEELKKTAQGIADLIESKFA